MARDPPQLAPATSCLVQVMGSARQGQKERGLCFITHQDVACSSKLLRTAQAI